MKSIKRTIDEHYIKIMVVGPGYGESILINIAGNILIGLDSCEEFLASTSPDKPRLLDQVLDDHDFKEKYWIFSHYHFDHYMGAGTLMTSENRTKFDQIYTPQEYSSKDMAYLVSEHAFNKTKDLALKIRARSEYVKLRQNTNDKYGSVTSINGTQEIVTRLFMDSKGIQNEVRVVLYSGSEQLKRKTIANSLNSILNDRELSRKVCNTCSQILRIQYGDKECWFLADAPKSRYTYIDFNGEVDFLKISHHGSKTGTSEASLNKFKSKEVNKIKSKAVITPYSPSKLPKNIVLDLIKEKGFDVCLTNAHPILKDSLKNGIGGFLNVKVNSSINLEKSVNLFEI